jgi:hypothetical protein
MVRLRTLDPPIGVRVPASQPNSFEIIFSTKSNQILLERD